MLSSTKMSEKEIEVQGSQELSAPQPLSEKSEFQPIIGTLGERSLHAALKQRYDPTMEHCEVSVGRYVADILLDDGEIIEIQTAAFHRLRAKLAAFLPEHIVTVVCPIAHTKNIIWLDPETGEVLRTKRSPKKWSAYDALAELYNIKNLLREPNLRLRIVLLDVDEYRFATRRNRKGYSRTDTVPKAVAGEMFIAEPSDFCKLIPPGLPEEFTRAEYQKAAKVSRKVSQCAVHTLAAVGALARLGKRGREILYGRVVAD